MAKGSGLDSLLGIISVSVPQNIPASHGYHGLFPLPPMVKELGCESGSWVLSGVDLKNAWSCTSTRKYFFLSVPDLVVRCEALRAVTVQSAVVWDMTPCALLRHTPT